MNKNTPSLLVTKLSDKNLHFASSEDYSAYSMHKQSIKPMLRARPVGMYRIHLESRLFSSKPRITIEALNIAAFAG